MKVMLALVTSAASAAAAIVYLAHKGNARANWFAICQQFDAFCERISGSLIGSFAAMVLLVLRVNIFGRISPKFRYFFVFAIHRENKFRYFSSFFVFKFKNLKIFIKNSEKI